MITLITGAPGHGKSLYVVSELLKLQDRNVVVIGIPDLKLPYPFLSLTKEEALDRNRETNIFNWYEWAAPGTLIVIDEAQNYFRPRRYQDIPRFITELEVHRSEHAIDIWFISQSYKFVHPHIHDNLDKHIHLRKTFLGRQLLEWMELGKPDTKTSRAVAAKRKYKLNKKAFDHYKSAEVHTTSAYRVPTYAVIFAASILISGAMGYKAYASMSEKSQTAETVPVVAEATPDAKPETLPLPSYLQPGNQQAPKRQPIQTAYAEPSRAAFPAACVVLRGHCRCYTDQATLLKDVSDYQCRDIVQNGIYDANPGYGAKPHVDNAMLPLQIEPTAM